MPDMLLSSKPVQIAVAIAVVLIALGLVGLWVYTIVNGHGDYTQPGDILSGLVYGGGVVGGGAAVHYIHTTRNGAKGDTAPRLPVVATSEVVQP